MIRPTALIATSDELLGRRLSEMLIDDVELRVTTQPEHLRYLLDTPADLVVLDQRNLCDGGLALIRLLEQVRPRLAQAKLLVLTPPIVPELLPRHINGPQAYLDSQHRTPEALAERIVQLLAPAEVPMRDPLPAGAPRSTPLDAGGETFNEVIFEGATRRFETRSPELKSMLSDVMVAAAHDVAILLIGETGSGKTFLSNLIHEASPRRQQPFLHVACGALPRELIESELFGHMKGSFTSAHVDKEGKFLAARQGTILLDEIDVLGPEQQVKLLRVIETGEFEPVGSNQTHRSQARLVVASNLELQPLVESGRFRPDLYYRLNMLKFEIPPLRRRKMDIIPLAKKFITRFQQKHGIPVHRVEESVLETLLAYPWPGNVRELEHVIQRAVIYCRDGNLTRAQLPAHLLSGKVGPTNDPTVKLGSATGPFAPSLEDQVALTEKEIIEQSLFKNNFSRTKTARDLGISRVTLYNKMKKFEMLK